MSGDLPMPGGERHAEVEREFVAATAEYEAALMSGDEERVHRAAMRLDGAEHAYGADLTDRVAKQQVRASLPTFAEMLAHPWSQPPEVVVPHRHLLARKVADGGIVYPDSVPSNTIDARPPRDHSDEATS